MLVILSKTEKNIKNRQIKSKRHSQKSASIKSTSYIWMFKLDWRWCYDVVFSMSMLMLECDYGG